MDINNQTQPITTQPQEESVVNSQGLPPSPESPTPPQSSGKNVAFIGTIVTILILTLVAGGGWYLLSMRDTAPATTTAKRIPSPESSTPTSIPTNTPEVSSDTLPDVGSSSDINTDFNDVNADVSEL